MHGERIKRGSSNRSGQDKEKQEKQLHSAVATQPSVNSQIVNFPVLPKPLQAIAHTVSVCPAATRAGGATAVFLSFSPTLTLFACLPSLQLQVALSDHRPNGTLVPAIASGSRLFSACVCVSASQPECQAENAKSYSR